MTDSRLTEHPRRIAVSGTYSTGKSTITEALSIATGIPRTHALTSREILAEINPDKTVMELDSVELIALGLRRYEERLGNETGLNAFISDGSVIHEWVYGHARALTGINPGATAVLRALKGIAGWRTSSAYRTYLDIYGQQTSCKAIELYDAFVHLPVEFPLTDDGHRPVSEPFRELSDQLLQQAVANTGLPVLIAAGTTRERLEAIVEHYRLPLVTDLDYAQNAAETRVAAEHHRLTVDANTRAQQRTASRTRQLRYAMRY